MKKSLIALAALAAAGAASAQSSVTLWGVVDANVGWYKDTSSVVKMNTSGLSSSQLGFRGNEDLGGGAGAGFWLEAGLNPDSGTGQATSLNNQATGAVAGNGGLIFNRRSTLSVWGGWGELRLGRDFTPGFWNLTVFDPFGTLGAAQSSNLNLVNSGTTGLRASNSVSYLFGMPGNSGSHGLAANGFYAQAMYHMGENASNVANSGDGSGYGLRLGYKAGALNVAGAYQFNKMAAVNNYKMMNLGMSYNLGFANLMAQYSQNDQGIAGVTGSKARNFLLGATIPMGNGYIPVSYNRLTTNNAASWGADQFGIGYVYNMSKRTSLYTNVVHLRNRNGGLFGISGGAAAGGGKAGGAEFGLKHSF